MELYSSHILIRPMNYNKYKDSKKYAGKERFSFLEIVQRCSGNQNGCLNYIAPKKLRWWWGQEEA